jgi:small subunit ribosomal protein S1
MSASRAKASSPSNEWDDPSEIDVGDEVEVLVEDIESDTGMILVSKRRADRILNWRASSRPPTKATRSRAACHAQDQGRPAGRHRRAGLPARLAGRHPPPGDIGEYIGQTSRPRSSRSTKERRNIVISRRKLIEEERAERQGQLLAEIEVGQIRKGVVKNIADFGAFVDLGGIDGLLHITDMSWDRIEHPSQMLKIDQEIEVKILSIDREKEKIALGLKQKTENPWEKVEERYPVNRVKGEVVNIMNYGAFVKLEPASRAWSTSPR